MNVAAPAPHSTFVTVLAWIAIIFNGFGAAIAVMQNVMVNFLMPTMIAGTPHIQGAPFPFALFRVIAFAFLIFAALMAYSGYALLKRRNWARLVFMVVCALGIAWSLFGILAFAIAFGFGHLPMSGSMAPPPEMRAVFNAMIVMTSVISLAMCALFIWMIWRLGSAEIRAEFDRGPVAP